MAYKSPTGKLSLKNFTSHENNKNQNDSCHFLHLIYYLTAANGTYIIIVPIYESKTQRQSSFPKSQS